MRMKFGVFLSPWHPPGQNPTRALHRDLELIEHLDRLGFDEVWIGEHQSGGYELITSPEVFIAAAAERTRHIRLGTGVSGVVYHHPFMLAGRMVLLDHLTRGRAMFGMGPGSLVQDAEMMGLDYMQGRGRLEEGLEAITHLLRSDEPLSMKTDWFELVDARLQLRPYTEPSMELAVAAVRSATGPHLSARFRTSLLSIAATDPKGGFDFIAETWKYCEEEAAKYGHTVDRRNWRLVSGMHVTPTLEQAIEETRYGIGGMLRFYHTGPFRSDEEVDVEAMLANTPHEDLVEATNSSGFASFGTPEMAKAAIQRLWDQTNGGFGTLLIGLHEVADPDATFRSLELFARKVMPEFQGQLERPQASWDRLYSAKEHVGKTFRGAQDQASIALTGEKPKI